MVETCDKYEKLKGKSNIYFALNFETKPMIYFKILLDFDLRFGLRWLTFHLMGIWPDDEKTERKSPTMQISFMIFSLIFSLALLQFYSFILVRNDLVMVIDNYLMNCLTVTSCTKLYFIWRSDEGKIISIITDNHSFGS